MTKTSYQPRKLSLILLFFLTFLLTLFLSLPWVSAQEETETKKPKPQDWEIKGIVAALADPYAQARLEAANKLAEYQLDHPKSQIPHYQNLVEQLVKQLSPQDKDLQEKTVSRQAAAKVLGQMQAKEFAPKVALLLKDSDTNVRSAAVSVLGQMQAKAFAPKVALLLKDSNSSVRDAAANALGQMQAKAFAPNVALLLKDSEWNVRDAAANALGQMQAKEIAPKVALLLKDSDLRVRYAAAYALGQMQAKEFAPNLALLLKDSNSDVRSAAAKVLGQMQAKEFAPNVALLLKDSDTNVRYAAVQALGQMQAKEIAPNLALLLKDSNSGLCFSDNIGNPVCNVVVKVLPKLGKQNFPQGLPVLVQVLDAVHKYPSEVGQFRYLAHFLSSGAQDVETLMKWIGKPKAMPKGLTSDEGRKIMGLFEQTWSKSDSLPELQQELAQKIAIVADSVKWQSQDIDLLQRHYKNLKVGGYKEADTVQRVILQREFGHWFFLAAKIILIHLAFWLALILTYSKFSQTLAAFFWNPWIRRLLGFGYIGLLLTWIPYLRRRLLEPFKPSLLADAGLDNFIDQAYFPNSNVKVPASSLPLTPSRVPRRVVWRRQPKPRQGSTDNIPSEIQPITQALPTLQGQIVLEGDSGLGKSMFLRHLVKNSQRLVVYLPAQQCDKGVIAAIYAKFPKYARDARFIKSLVYSRAIDICIDGLNEVTADTRAKISQFAESYSRGNMIMTTQPLEWIPPSTAKKYELQPLQPEQIQQFLISRQLRLPQDATLQDAEYEQACSRYIAEAFNDQQSPEDLAAAKQILSNPMDLTLVALMLSQDKQPNLFRLQEQQYQLMAEEYQREWQQEFPLQKFSQAVYQMRLDDESAIPSDEFHQELSSMENEKYKMVVSRQQENSKGKYQKNWYFRHDKIMEFFLVQNFRGESEEVKNRIIQHIDDPRFRGVYLLLVNLLPLVTALELREILIEYAANTKDHTLSDKFVQLLKLRLPQWAQDKRFRQLIQQHEQKDKCLDLAVKFLELVGAKIKREKEQHLTIESIEGSLRIYTPFSVLVTVDSPTDQDVIRITKISAHSPGQNTANIGLLLYTTPPDATARMEIAKVRLRDHFVVIPIPLTSVEKALPNNFDCVGLLEEYVDRYLQRADFFDDKNAISDTLSFFGRTELLQRLAEELLRSQGIGLFGLRKSGKTSVLFQLSFMLREHPIVHIDLQRYGGSRYGAVLFNDILQYLSTLETEITLPHFEPFSLDKPATELTVEFIQRVGEFSRVIQKSNEYKLPILCFLDEVERIIPAPEDPREKAEEFNACFGALRVLCQEKQQLSLLIADVHPDCNRINSWQQKGVATNPVFSFFKEIFLPPFSAKETQEMLVNIGKIMGIEFDEATPKEIHRQSGGYPFVSRQLARFLTERIKDNHINNSTSKNGNLLIEWTMVERYLEKIVSQKSELKNYLEKSIWEDLEKRDFQVAIAVLRTIACNEQLRKRLTEQALVKQLRGKFTANECLDACHWLTSVGLLDHEEVEHEDIYCIRIPLLSQWIHIQMTDEEIKKCQIL